MWWSRHINGVILMIFVGFFFMEEKIFFLDYQVYVNNLNENLKLSSEYDLQAINFLNLQIYFHLQKND